MKIKLYFEGEKAIKKSGIGRALKHQLRALFLNNIEATNAHSVEDYDILHVNTYWLASLIEVYKAKRKHKKVVVHAHSTMEDFQNSFVGSSLLAPFYKKWLVFFYSRGDVIITPTPYSKSILESYGLKQKIYAISNGIDLEEYKPNKQYEQEFRQYFNLKEDQKVIICVGWFFLRKGFDTFAHVANNMKDYTFIWFGDLEMSVPPKEILDEVKNKPDNLILPGYISGNVIKGAFSNADLFFFPTREETEGIVVLEALASKTPVLVRDIKAFEPWLVDGVNCRKGKDEQEFISIIEEMMSSDLSTMIDNGYETAKERELENVGKQLVEVYNSL